MSALTPHIRVLRALAETFGHQVELAKGGSQAAWEVMDGIQSAFACAAEQLESEEQALAEPLKPRESDVTYNPRGKKP